MKKLINIIVIFLAFIPSLAFAQNVATVSLDTNKADIGTHLKMNLQIETDNKNIVFFPAFSDSLKNIEFIDQGKIDTAFNKKTGRQTLSKTVVFTVFEAGVYTFPPMPFYVLIPGTTNPSEILTNELQLTIEAPEIDMNAEIKDIQNIIEITFWDIFKEFCKEHYVALIIALVAALLIGFGIFFYIRYKQNRPIFFAPKPAIPPHIMALEQLEKLRQEKLWQNNLVKEYYTRLTDILREYLENGLRINAQEMISDEIIYNLELTDIPNKTELISTIRHTLSTADFVKFAKSNPLPDEHDRCFTDVENFIKTISEWQLATIAAEKEKKGDNDHA